jgi:hypothetical protein
MNALASSGGSLTSASHRTTAGSTADPQVPLAVVPSAFQGLHRDVSQLHYSIEALAGRLAPVLRPHEPRESPAKDPSESRFLVDIADNISDEASSVRSATALINDLVNRLGV